jgi:AcrR family transcriptional regulator
MSPSKSAPAEKVETDDGPRRTSLAQERSRRTRQLLVTAALDLWTKRGFERGVEETTVAEITKAAGVTKSTFYFHFAHKEDILLELGWGTASAMDEDVRNAIGRGLPPAQVLKLALATIARRVERVPPAAVRRALGEFRRPPRPGATVGDHFGMRRGFEQYVRYAQAQGELAAGIDAQLLAVIMEGLTTDALGAWIHGAGPLKPLLTYRIDVAVRGADAIARDAEARSTRRRA